MPLTELSPLCKLLQLLSSSLITENFNYIKSTCTFILGILKTDFRDEKEKMFLLYLLSSDFMKNLKLGLKSFL